MIVTSSKHHKFEKTKIAEKILKSLIIGISIPMVLASPHGSEVLIKTAEHYFRRRDFNREAKRLQKSGFIALTKTDKGWLLKLLPKGRVKLNEISFEEMILPKPRTWDGKWRLFSFDIPEEFKNARNMLRRKLKSLGCYNIQRSLLAYPYDCKKELEQITEHYKVTKFTLYAEVSYIDLDKELRKFFKL